MTTENQLFGFTSATPIKSSFDLGGHPAPDLEELSDPKSESKPLAECTALDLPSWVEEKEDKSSVFYHEAMEIFWETDEDFDNGLSHFTLAKEKDPTCTTYEVGSHQTFDVFSINGKPWCAFEAAADLAGVSAHSITGWCGGDFINKVRGAPGWLLPDGIRYLGPQGVSDHGIRVEALANRLEKSNSLDPRVLNMVNWIVSDFYANRRETSGTKAATSIDAFGKFYPQKVAGQIGQVRFSDPDTGSIHVVLLGTTPWFRLDEISKSTGLPPASLLKMAGKPRILEIPESSVYPLYDTGQNIKYLRGDFVEKVHAAMPQPWGTEARFPVRIAKFFRKSSFAEHGPKVKASCMHKMLGSHLTFEAWNHDMRGRHTEDLRAIGSDLPFKTDNDYRIPLMLAAKIAADYQNFIGNVTSCLISNGGYRHGGAIDESADATLERFRDIVPNCQGYVKIAKIWEFHNPFEGFEDWFQARAMANWSFEETPEGPMASIESAWCDDLWEKFHDMQYDPVLKPSPWGR